MELNKLIKLINLVEETHIIAFGNNNWVLSDSDKELEKIVDSNTKIDRTNKEIFELLSKSNTNSFEIVYYDKYIFRYILDLTITIIPININALHLSRFFSQSKEFKLDDKLQFIIKENNLTNFLLDLNKITQIILTDYCTCCGNQLKTKGLEQITVCLNVKCIEESFHTVIDDRICDLVIKDIILIELLLEIFIKGTTHPKADKTFNPFPNIKNIKTIKQLILKLNEEKTNIDINLIKNYCSDIELYKTIGSTAYAIINNAISNNYFSLSTINNFRPEIMNIQSSIKINSIFDSPDIKFINLNYSHEIESRFKKENFLFHGTPLYSWYPIIKNGLKVMSGTEFQANGAVHGTGIYFSDSFDFSLGYSTRIGGKRIVGVFEINDDINKYLKTSQIYVINDDKILLLRYLIIVEEKFTGSCKELTDFFFKILGSLNKNDFVKSSNIKNKRLNKEMKLLESNELVSGVNIINEITHWEINCKKKDSTNYSIQVYFNDYPKLPPKIIIPEIKSIPMLIDKEGNVLLPEITLSGWNLTTTLTNLVDKINKYLNI